MSKTRNANRFKEKKKKQQKFSSQNIQQGLLSMTNTMGRKENTNKQ